MSNEEAAVTSKKCNTCGVEIPLSTRGGKCRSCKRKVQQARYAKNRRELLDRAAACRKARWPICYEQNMEWKRKTLAAKPLLWALYSAKSRAKKRGMDFSLKIEDLPTPEFCPVFGTRLIYNSGKRNPDSPSIDRIDPLKGYVRGNVAVISFRANAIKSNATLAEILAIGRYMQAELGKNDLPGDEECDE